MEQVKKINIGITLNLGFTVIEYIAGFASGSLALISDASHNLTDVLSMVIAGIAAKVADKKSDRSRTYGYGRATILAALLNTLIFYLLAAYIFYEAYHRLMNPAPVNGGLVSIVAAIGIIFNTLIAFNFAHEKNDINIRSVFLHQVYDAITSAGALLAGLIVIFTGKTIFDPIISIIIGLMMTVSAWSLTKKAFHILLEGVPEDIDFAQVEKEIRGTPLVKSVDDLHIWSISSNSIALSCHIIIEDCNMEKSTPIVADIKNRLKQNFNISHATIETELTECLPET